MTLQESRCPRCGGKLTETKNGKRLRCSERFCMYTSEILNRGKILEILNYEPTKVDLAIDMLTRKSEYVQDYNIIGDFVELEVAIEIIKEMFEEKKDNEVLKK